MAWEKDYVASGYGHSRILVLKDVQAGLIASRVSICAVCYRASNKPEGMQELPCSESADPRNPTLEPKDMVARRKTDAAGKYGEVINHAAEPHNDRSHTHAHTEPRHATA